MIPLKDDNQLKNRSYVRLIILIICSIIFLIQISSNNKELLIYYFGFKPATLFYNTHSPTFTPLLTIITSIFMHGGWMHYLGNMLYLWIFADNVEDVMGYKRFIIFYLVSGIFASLSQAAIDLQSNVPIIGASGAIAGILGSYLYLFPKARVLVLVPFFIFFTIRVPAYILLIFWFIYQFLNLGNQASNVAWLAHIGGFVYGYLYSLLFLTKAHIQSHKGKSVFLKKKGPWS
jgi:membrane associated rhomboid family serine protease